MTSYILSAWSDGDKAALEQLMPMVYQELRADWRRANMVIRIPFPSQLKINKQHLIIEYLDELKAKVDALKKYRTKPQRTQRLMPSILS